MTLPAVVLAGGRGRRLGGVDKALLPLAGRPLLAHVLDRLRAGAGEEQAGPLALNANGDRARFAAFGLPVLPDDVPGLPGPLAGIVTALRWAVSLGAPAVMTVPCDTPFLPRDLAARLAAASDGAGGVIACAASAGRVHPVAALWPVGLRDALAAALDAGERKVDAWAAAQGRVVVPFADAGVDPFLNVNTPADVAEAERILSASAGG